MMVMVVRMRSGGGQQGGGGVEDGDGSDLHYDYDGIFDIQTADRFAFAKMLV